MSFMFVYITFTTICILESLSLLSLEFIIKKVILRPSTELDFTFPNVPQSNSFSQRRNNILIQCCHFDTWTIWKVFMFTTNNSSNYNFSPFFPQRKWNHKHNSPWDNRRNVVWLNRKSQTFFSFFYVVNVISGLIRLNGPELKKNLRHNSLKWHQFK